MKKLKKMLGWMLILCLCLPQLVVAEESLTEMNIANGVVQAVSHVDLVAPYSGTLRPFDVTVGDAVEAGTPLFSMLTTTVYATENGTVSTVFAMPGDDAAATTARYGGVMAIAPAVEKQVTASRMGASKDEKDKRPSAGTTLYFRSSLADREEGSGVVSLVQGDQFVVDILSGEFETGESLTLYRDDKYNNKQNVGKGVVAFRPALMPTAVGRVAQVFVENGQDVKPGTPLFSVMTADSDPESTPDVLLPSAGVVTALAVAPGQQVWKGALLARVDLTDALEVVAEVDEVDLKQLKVGDTIPVTLDMRGDERLGGEVTEISSLGVTRQNAAYFTVHVAIPAGRAPLGASASIYLKK